MIKKISFSNFQEFLVFLNEVKDQTNLVALYFRGLDRKVVIDIKFILDGEYTEEFLLFHGQESWQNQFAVWLNINLNASRERFLYTVQQIESMEVDEFNNVIFPEPVCSKCGCKEDLYYIGASFGSNVDAGWFLHIFCKKHLLAEVRKDDDYKILRDEKGIIIQGYNVYSVESERYDKGLTSRVHNLRNSLNIHQARLAQGLKGKKRVLKFKKKIKRR